jgi:hypothetical protein
VYAENMGIVTWRPMLYACTALQAVREESAAEREKWREKCEALERRMARESASWAAAAQVGWSGGMWRQLATQHARIPACCGQDASIIESAAPTRE